MYENGFFKIFVIYLNTDTVSVKSLIMHLHMELIQLLFGHNHYQISL
jgi:hypothetical protein